MRHAIILLLLLSSQLIFSQNKKVDRILEEGKLMYRLEKGSWYATDDMLGRFETKKDSLGGYLSYENDDKKIITIFFSRFDSDEILIHYEFNEDPIPVPWVIDYEGRRATSLEKELIAIRQNALAEIYSEENDFFRFHENTSFNIIPIIKNGKRTVFVLTATTKPKTVVLGNDYKLSFNKKNKLKKKEKLHESLLEFPFISDAEEHEVITSYHSHIITKYITSTDVCTLLLYKDALKLKQHIVISKKMVSIFDLERISIFTLKTKQWKKIRGHE